MLAYTVQVTYTYGGSSLLGVARSAATAKAVAQSHRDKVGLVGSAGLDWEAVAGPYEAQPNLQREWAAYYRSVEYVIGEWEVLS